MLAPIISKSFIFGSEVIKQFYKFFTGNDSRTNDRHNNEPRSVDRAINNCYGNDSSTVDCDRSEPNLID